LALPRRIGREGNREVPDPAKEISDQWLVPVRSPIRRILGVWLPPVVGMAVLLIVWIALIRWKNTPPLLAPSPGDIINGMRDNYGDLLTALQSTANEVLEGLGLSIVFGAGLAILMSQARWLERAIFPYTTLAQTIPIFAVAPLVYQIAGDGHTAIVGVALLVAIFPIIANTSLGLASVDADQINLFRMYNASRLQELTQLRLPSAIPYILTGIRVSSGLAVIGAIVGQFLLGTGDPSGGGLGYEIQVGSYNGDWGLVGAAAITAALLGIAVFIILGILNNLALRRWHESAVPQEN
jgi:NitT/TauT family transport system permease protein